MKDPTSVACQFHTSLFHLSTFAVLVRRLNILYNRNYIFAYPSTADDSLNDLEKCTQYHVTSSLLSPMVTWMEKIAFLVVLVYSACLVIIWLSGLPCFHFLFVSVWCPFCYGKQAFCIPGLNGWAGAVSAREWVSEHVVLEEDINSVFSSPPFVCYIKEHFTCRCFQASFKKYHYYPLSCSPPQSCICLFVLYVNSFLWCILLCCVVLKKMFLFCVNYICVVVCLEAGGGRKGASYWCCKSRAWWVRNALWPREYHIVL